MRVLQALVGSLMAIAAAGGAEQFNGKEFIGQIPYQVGGPWKTSSGFARRMQSGGSRKRRAARRFAQVHGRRMKCGR